MSEADPGAVWEEGELRSSRFGDIYASREGALAQAQAVFLQGSGLPQRWVGRRHFVIAELGFGTGLNMLAAIALWREHRPQGAVLQLFSVEGFPLAAADAARAIGRWPELLPLAEPLLKRWPSARGMHRFEWPELGVILDLAVMEAGEALAGWDGQADAWFLDGFSPALNPEMWAAPLLAEVGLSTAPGGTATTWSVASAVREGLSAAGFAVSKQPGFGEKRHRLQAVMPGEPVEHPSLRIGILGAGISGAALARAFRALGHRAVVMADGPGASTNPAALISARLATGSGDATKLHAQAFRRAVALVRETAPEAIIATGVNHPLSPSERPRAEATIASGLYAEGSMRLDETLWLGDALVVDPAMLRGAWVSDVSPVAVTELVHEDGWRLDGQTFDILCVAAGYAAAELAGLPLRPVRGQVTFADVPLDGPAQSWGGYVVPTRSGMLFGATHGRGDAGDDVRDDDRATNLAGLHRALPEVTKSLEGAVLTDKAGVRAAAPDHQPVAGRMDNGLFVLGALGGRGFTLAPLLAEHVAALALGLPSPLLKGQQRLVDPRRILPRMAGADVPPANPSTA